jgi:dienelactone hydrolase
MNKVIAAMAAVLLSGCLSGPVHRLPGASPGTGAWERVLVPSLDDDGPGAGPVMLDGYLFRPAGGGSHPAVVFLHGCGGLVSAGGSIQARELDWAGRLTGAGYVVLMVDSFSARGVKTMCSPATFQSAIYQVRPKDAYGALRYLQAQPFIEPDRIAVMGWSLGGGTVLFTIDGDHRPESPSSPARPNFRAAVAFYPASCDAGKLPRGWSTDIPLLVLVGGADVWTPAGPCQAAMQTLAERGVPVAVQVYPGAYHDFDWPNLPTRELSLFRTSHGVVPIVGMDPAARADALTRVPAFLRTHLGGEVALPEAH